MEHSIMRNVLKKGIKLSSNAYFSVAICIDGSNSISADEFEGAKKGCVEIVKLFEHPNIFFHVSQFSHFCVSDELKGGWSKNKVKVTGFIRKMEQIRQGTNTADVFREYQSIFQKTPSKSKKILILVTDGNPDDQSMTLQRASELKSSYNVDIYTIGIGKFLKDKLKEISGDEYSYSLEDFLEQISRHYFRSVIDSEIIFTFRHTQKTCLTEPMSFEIDIYNTGDVPILNNSKVVVSGGKFYIKKSFTLQEEIKPYEEKSVQVQLMINESIDIDDLPNEINVEILHPLTNCPYYSPHSGFFLQLRNITMDLIEWTPVFEQVKKANIIIFGIVGSGKSTLINNMIKLWSNKYEEHAATGNLSSHLTIKTSFIEFDSRARFRFLDTTGLSPNNYLFSEFNSILEGTLKEGYQVESASESDHYEKHKKVKSEMTSHGKEERMAHGVVFVAQDKDGVEQDTKMIIKLKGHVEEAVKKGLKPLLVVTKVDRVGGGDGGGDLRSSYIDNIKKKSFSSIIGIDEQNIFVVDNSPDDQKTIEREKVFYQILKKSLINCQDIIKSSFDVNLNLNVDVDVL